MLAVLSPVASLPSTLLISSPLRGLAVQTPLILRAAELLSLLSYLPPVRR